MANAEVSYIIKAIDQATGTMKDVRKGMDGMAQESQKTVRTMNAAFGLLKTVSGAALQSFGKKVTGVVLDFAAAGRGSIEETKKLNAVLESTKGAAGLTAKDVQGIATSLQNVTNYEDDVIVSGQNMLLTFTNIGKDVFPSATEAMLNMSTAMGTDVTSTAMQLGKALNNPVEGISALTRLGVQFTEEQKKMIKTMMENGDTAGAQQIVLDELGKKYGGMATATADASTMMKNSMGDIKEEIGKALVPAIDSAAAALLPYVQKIGQIISDNPQLVAAIGGAAAIFGTVLTVMGTAAVTIGAVQLGLAAIGVTLGAGAALALAIAGISGLVVTMMNHWEGLKWMAGNACDWMVTKATQAADAIQGLVDRMNVARQTRDLAELATFEVKDYAGPKLKGRAGGGRVNESMTLVGENGPELVSLPRGSYVHTARASAGMMGGGGLNISAPLMGTVHVHNEADEERLAAKIQKQLARLIQLQNLQAA